MLELDLDGMATRAGGYMKQRIKAELGSLATVADVLSLIELWQEGRPKEELYSALGFQILSRAHWSIGFIRAAAHTGIEDEKAWKALGKEAFFWTAAHYLPHVMGTAKMVFDIEHLLVKITLNPVFNDLDANLVDALYTGEWARRSDTPSGWATRYREGVDCILTADYILRSKGKDGKPIIQIDQPRLFAERFKSWTGGVEYDQERRPEHPLVKAFDAYRAAREKQLESIEPTWVVDGQFRPSPVPEQGAVREAFDRLWALVTHKCKAEAKEVIANSAVRGSLRYKEEDDRILTGLTERYSHDFIMGMENTLQAELVERLLARRHIERSAALADAEVIAKSLAAALDPQGGELPEFELQIGDGRHDAAREYDGTEPVPLTCQLRLRGERPANMPDVHMEIIPGEVRNLTDPSRPPRAGDLVRGPVTVRAIAQTGSGAELAKATVELTVRLGQPKPQMEFAPIKPIEPGNWVDFAKYLKVTNPPKEVEYRWDFGDGRKARNDRPRERNLYSNSGDYTVSVQMFDRAATPPKLVAEAKGLVKVVAKSLIPKLKACQEVSVHVRAEIEEQDIQGESFVDEVITVFGRPLSSSETASFTWEGTSFAGSNKLKDKTGKTYAEEEISGRVSEDGLVLKEITAKKRYYTTTVTDDPKAELVIYEIALVNVPVFWDEGGSVVYQARGDRAPAHVKTLLYTVRKFRGNQPVDRSVKRFAFKSPTDGLSVTFNK